MQKNKLKRIIVVTHYLVYGAGQALRDYLIKEEIDKLLFIAHPLYTGKELSYCEIIEDGKIKETKISSIRTSLPIINYFIEVILTLKWVITTKGKYDLFIGFNNLNTFAGLILIILKKINKVIYYTIDFSPHRFNNNFLNALYHKIDTFCLKYADVTWNVSPRIAEGRKKLFGINYRNKQKVVPIGVWIDRIKIVPYDKIKKHQLLFVGHLLEKQGIQLVIDAIPIIIKKIPDFHFLIIGGGEYKRELINKVKRMNLNEFITFTGWMTDRKKLDRMLPESACAIAPYDPNKSEYTYYADPTKIKDYLSAGLPVIMTSVPFNAQTIQDKKCGYIVNYNKESIAKAVIDLMKDHVNLMNYRKNAIKHVKQYDWMSIFSKALQSL